MIESSPSVLLEARHLTRRLPDGTVLLDDIRWTIHAGERWVVTGPTGAGKTLLLRALALLDPLEEGTVYWRGKEVLPAEVPAFRREVIYVQQRPALTEGTVEDNLQLPFQFRVHQHAAYNRERVLALLSRLQRDARFLQKQQEDLSGGERQLTALLRAVQLEPAVLLLDEVTASLDAAAAQQVEQLIADWYQSAPAERSAVWVTHRPEQILREAGRQLKLKNGRVVALET